MARLTRSASSSEARRAAEVALDHRLGWWGNALKEARAKSPYSPQG
ncbi:hypothetical protein ACF090_26850 [Streptomyces sp. NPDC014892]